MTSVSDKQMAAFLEKSFNTVKTESYETRQKIEEVIGKPIYSAEQMIAQLVICGALSCEPRKTE